MTLIVAPYLFLLIPEKVIIFKNWNDLMFQGVNLRTYRLYVSVLEVYSKS